MRRLARTAVAAALAMALLVPATQPALATDVQFTWLGCAGQPVVTTGTLDTFTVSHYSDGVWHGSVSGSILPCRPPTSGDVFAIASYDASGYATARAALYPNTNSYSALFQVRLTKTAAVCLIDEYKGRLDCIEIGWKDQEGGDPPRPEYYGNHLPSDSPVVNVIPEVSLGGSVIHPPCPTCVQD
jgi:hypothetical protein